MTKTWGSRSTTRHISKRTVQATFRGFDYAKASGQGFTHLAVINLRDDARHDPARTAAKLVHRYRDWLAYRRKKTGAADRPVYFRSLENPDNNPHMNWVVRVPAGAEIEFEKKLRLWVERVQGPVGPYDIHVQPVTPGYEKRLAKYVVKGADPRCIQHFYLQDVHAPQGVIVGRRTSISRSIGEAARKRVGFHPGRRRPYVPTGAGGPKPGTRPQI